MIEELKNVDWYLWCTRPYSLGREYVILREYMRRGLKIFLLLPNNKDSGDYYVDKKGFFTAMESVWNEALQNHEEHLESYEGKKKKLLLASTKLSESAGKEKDETLIKLYENYLEQTKDFIIYLILPFPLAEICEPRLREEYPDEFEIISAADQPCEYQKMEKMLLEKPLQEVWKEYCYLNCYAVHEKEYSVKDLENIRDGLNKKHIKKTFKEFEKNKENYDRFLETISDEKDRAEIILLHEYAWLRNERIEAWKKNMHQLKEFYDYIKNKAKISSRAAGNLSPKEIKKILRGEKISPEAKKRDGAFLYWYNNPKEVHFILDKKEIQEIREYLEMQIKISDELTGMSASPGKATGTAAVVQSLGELAKVKQGNILVTQNTDPRYTPYMKRCAGIVTDEGGVLSHAAITSRELGIPCIIATKTATKAFKDGDLVEVDANKGVVRKVE